MISVIDKQDPERGGSLLLASLLAVALVSIPACGNDSNTINTVEERIAIVDVLSVPLSSIFTRLRSYRVRSIRSASPA